HSRIRSAPARRASGEDAPAPRDGRTSLRHHQGQDGSNPFPDEDAAASCLRDGATRVGLQSDPGHQHHGHSAAHARDESQTKLKKGTPTPPNKNCYPSNPPAKLFYTPKVIPVIRATPG